MGVNKVEFGGETLIDLTEDTVTPETLAEGATATNAQGEKIVGTLSLNSVRKYAYQMTDDYDTVLDLINYLVEQGYTFGNWCVVKISGLTTLGLTILHPYSNVYEIGAMELLSARTIYQTKTSWESVTLVEFIGSFVEPVATEHLQSKTDENLETESKEIVGAINELNEKMVTGGDSSGCTSITVGDLTGTSWSIPAGWSATAGYGTFKINGKLNYFSDGRGFTRDFTQIKIGQAPYGPAADYVEFSYGAGSVYQDSTEVFSLVITDGDDATNSNLINWHRSSGKLLSVDLAVFQSKTDPALETGNKTVIGAINELLGKQTQSPTHITMAATYGTTLQQIKEALMSARADYTGVNFVTLTGSYYNTLAVRLSDNGTYHILDLDSLRTWQSGGDYNNILLGNLFSGKHLDTNAQNLSAAINELNKKISEGGLDGKSAYQVAVDNGFEGTEEEWLASLKGDSYTLTEADKTEIAEQAAEKVDTSNLATVDKITSIDTWMSGVSELDKSDGISWRDSFAINDTLASGEIYHRIPIVAGNNVEFEVDQENQVVKINATGGGSAESVVGTWVFNDVLNIPEGFNGRRFTVSFTTTGWYNETQQMNEIYFYTTDGEDILSYYGPNGDYDDIYCNGWGSYHNFNIITITEEPTDIEFVTWLKANATKQEESGASNGLEMPQIRFVGMPCEGWFGYVDLSDLGEQYKDLCDIKFTVEIVGGGALQVGDTLQICRMSSYGGIAGFGDKKPRPPKRKLRRMVEYAITEEDLESRFITVTVPWDSKKGRRLLDEAPSHKSNISPIYFRIRRPKGEINSGSNGGGMTVDAQFSNVVTVWKASQAFEWYDENGEPVEFYHIQLA